jgi:hypothetical protein
MAAVGCSGGTPASGPRAPGLIMVWSLCVCVRACVRACVRVCVCVCVWMRGGAVWRRASAAPVSAPRPLAADARHEGRLIRGCTPRGCTSPVTWMHVPCHVDARPLSRGCTSSHVPCREHASVSRSPARAGTLVRGRPTRTDAAVGGRGPPPAECRASESAGEK